MASVKFATFLIFSLLWAGTIIDISNARVPSHKVPSVGGWNIIKNLSDPEVIAIAEFAVQEHNHKGNNNGPLLKFEKLVKGYYQVVAGFNYRLFLSAQSAERDKQLGSGMYVANVFVGLDNSKTLRSFTSYSNDV